MKPLFNQTKNQFRSGLAKRSAAARHKNSYIGEIVLSKKTYRYGGEVVISNKGTVTQQQFKR